VLAAVETFNKPARIGSGVPPHQDNAYFCRTPPDMLTVWIAIDAVTKANGPVTYVKGSHRLGPLATKPSGVRGNSIGIAEMPEVKEEDLLVGLLDPGDATIHHCDTIHYSDPNTTDHPRLGFLLVFRGAHTGVDPALKEVYSAAATATPPA
jgi:ectoine hydroxylase-related dioxygenase (phytanoyl-CoA dioxygenase family)